MRQRQLALLEKQKNRKPFGAVANDLPASSAVPIGKTGWGKLIAVGVDQPGCMADEPMKKKSNEGGSSITVIKSPASGSTLRPLEEEKSNIGAHTPAKSPASGQIGRMSSDFTDDEVIDVGTCDEVRAGRNGNEDQRNKILREADQTEKVGGWDMHVDARVPTPPTVVESVGGIDADDAPMGGQKKNKWWNPFKKEETRAPAPPVKKPVNEDTGAVTAISSFGNVPSTPPDFGGRNISSSVDNRNEPRPGPRPGRRNRGDQGQVQSTNQSFSSQDASSAKEDEIAALKAKLAKAEAEAQALKKERSTPASKFGEMSHVDPYNQPRQSTRRDSGEVTSIMSMGMAEEEEDKPKFSKPKRNLVQSQPDMLPGCLDEPDDVIGWD